MVYLYLIAVDLVQYGINVITFTSSRLYFELTKGPGSHFSKVWVAFWARNQNLKSKPEE